MISYTDPSDKTFFNEILEGAPSQLKAWKNFDQSLEDGAAIPAKYRELISIAVALTTQCPYCLERHTATAKELGVTKQELAETIMITSALRSGAAIGYGLMTMKLFKGE